MFYFELHKSVIASAAAKSAQHAYGVNALSKRSLQEGVPPTSYQNWEF